MSLIFTANLSRDKFDRDTGKSREHLFKLTATENINVANRFIFKFTQKSFSKHPAIYDHHLSFFLHKASTALYK